MKPQMTLIANQDIRAVSLQLPGTLHDGFVKKAGVGLFMLKHVRP